MEPDGGTAKKAYGTQRALYSPNHAAHELDISRSKIYALMKCGALGFVQIGSDRRIPASEIDRLSKEGVSA